jgi:dGTP triphosphohydrolase
MSNRNNFFRDDEFEDGFDIDDSSLDNPELLDSASEEKPAPMPLPDEEESELRVDKIFDNKFLESDYDGQRVNFAVDQSFHSYEEVEDKFHYKQLFDRIHNLVQESEFKAFNVMNDEKKMQKLNKMQINQVYSYIVNNVDPSVRKIDIFSVISDYFDIYPNKFYSSLSNKYKNELILELDAALNILKKKKIRKLF